MDGVGGGVLCGLGFQDVSPNQIFANCVMEVDDMGMFQKAKNEQAYLKCAIQGFAGSGKSFSAAMIAIGLHSYINSKKPVMFMDTETGSDYLLKHFDGSRIPVMTCWLA